MNCKICKSSNTREVLSLKNLPISNNYSKVKKDIYVPNYNIFLCKVCSLVQVKKNFNLLNLVPKNKKLKQNEPEEHLDGLVNKIIKKRILNKKSNILCLSYKDTSLSDRFKKKGYKNVDILNYKSFFNSPNIFFENIEDFNSKNYFLKSSKKKKYDLIIARHIIEHFFDPKKLVQNLKVLLNQKNGFIYFEIPDSLKSMKQFDYNMLWEQHKMYFTKNTLKKLMSNSQFKTTFCDIYKYKYENCILYLGQFNNQKNNLNNKIDKNEYYLSLKYFSKLKKIRKNLETFFKNLSRKNNLLIYGAGHQTIMYLYLFKLKKYINFVVDDNKNYINKYLPGTNIKIRKKSNKMKFKYCFISANHKNENKIIKNNLSFLNKKQILSLSFFNKSKGSSKHF